MDTYTHLKTLLYDDATIDAPTLLADLDINPHSDELSTYDKLNMRHYIDAIIEKNNITSTDAKMKTRIINYIPQLDIRHIMMMYRCGYKPVYNHNRRIRIDDYNGIWVQHAIAKGMQHAIAKGMRIDNVMLFYVGELSNNDIIRAQSARAGYTNCTCR